MERRKFFMDGDRLLVGELDGTVHEAEPNDPDLSESIVYSVVDVPVIDGFATLPDGRRVASSATVIRVPYLDAENAQRLRDSLPPPEIECLCGDIFYSTADMHEHLHLSHPELDHD